MLVVSCWLLVVGCWLRRVAVTRVGNTHNGLWTKNY